MGVEMAQCPSATDAELPKLMIADRWESLAMPAKYTETQASGRSRLPSTTGALRVKESGELSVTCLSAYPRVGIIRGGSCSRSLIASGLDCIPTPVITVKVLRTFRNY